MADLSIHEPKMVVDVVSAFFDFSADLLPAETISSAVCTVSVHTGLDNNPAAMLYQVVTITSYLCEQKIQKGLPGVVYDVLMSVITSTGRTVEQITRIAILPDANPAVPVYIPLYFTSRIYPIEAQDNFFASTTLLSGHTLINPYTVESIITSTSMNTGSLYGSVISYIIPHEDLQVYTSMLTGSLFGNIVTYNIPAEGILGVTSMLDGSLFNAIVSYDIPSENLQAFTSMLAGTLS